MTDLPVAPIELETQLGAFGATVAGVTGLVPQARLATDAVPLNGREFGVTVDQVAAWILELTSRVEFACDRWSKLAPGVTVLTGEDAGTPWLVVTLFPGTDLARFLAAARDLVHNGAASYLQAARQPERASVNADTYAEVLWRRFETGLDQLAGWVLGIVGPRDRDGDGTPDGMGRAAGSFPPVLFPDRLAW